MCGSLADVSPRATAITFVLPKKRLDGRVLVICSLNDGEGKRQREEKERGREIGAKGGGGEEAHTGYLIIESVHP